LAPWPAFQRWLFPIATPVDLIFTATERDRIAFVAFVASVNPTNEVKVAQEGRVTEADEDAHEAATDVS